MDALAIKQGELAAVVDKLAALDAALTAAKQRKAQLESDYKLCSEKLERAGKLIGGLGGEKVRWGDAAANLGEQLCRLSGDILMAAGYCSYLGPFTMSYRCVARVHGRGDSQSVGQERGRLGSPARAHTHLGEISEPRAGLSVCAGRQGMVPQLVIPAPVPMRSLTHLPYIAPNSFTP